MKIIVGISRHDNPADVDEAYGEGTYARLFPDDEGHYHTCQQCDKQVGDICDCDDPQTSRWCSARCKAAFDL